MLAVDVHKLGAATILQGDVRESLGTLPADCFHCVVTSPPYWSLRSYLPKDCALKSLELGSEPTPEAYIDNMVSVFREVRRVLRGDGLCWVDIGDSYTSGGRSTYRSGASGNKGHEIQNGMPRPETPPGLKPGDLCLIPARLALALQADGWYVRQIVVWAKPAPMPESVSGTRWERCRVRTWPDADVATTTELRRDRQSGRNFGPPTIQPCPGCDKCRATGGYVLRCGSWRCTTAHEYVLMLAKSQRYFADQEAVKGKSTSADYAGGPGRDFNGKTRDVREQGQQPAFRAITQTRNPRSVWAISAEPLSEPHYAAFPSKLPEKCINASTSAKGCCPKCGAQIARIVESAALKRERPNDWTKRTGEDGTGNRCPNTVVGVESTTIGWRSTCDCPEAANPVPCRVLDPFGGSGTTALQALRMGREATLCELNPDYVAMATRRIRAEFGLFTEVA